MPTLKINPEFVEKLKKLDCYDQWKANLITQWRHAENKSGSGVDFVDLQNNATKYFYGFVSNSFNFSLSPQGDTFWRRVIDY